MMNNEALVQKLVQSVRLFAGFDVSEAQAFLNASKLEQHPAGRRLIEEGTTGYQMYVMLSGEVAVKRRTGATDTVLTRLGPGDTFGELALLDFGARSATVEVISDTRVLVAERASLFRLTALESKLYRNLAIMMASRLRETDAMLGKLAEQAETRKAIEQVTSEAQRFFVG